ncbi:MAG TPA: BlaI/MecI/CopY family transcriptional regulator [Pirellulales bacterium]|jgi:predicted transcriptional regulator|nr:BlaI/MecI/CopY family transcriptional regulator [Pirellulales bacterium]
MGRTPADALSRRERQIMDVVYAQGEASAADVRAALPDPPSYSAVRALLAILVDKGRLKHRSQQGRYIYVPTRRRDQAGRSALRRVLDTFFEGSLEKAVAALLQGSDANLSEQDLKGLGRLIQQARKEGR